MQRTVIAALASAIQARLANEATGNAEWHAKHGAVIDAIARNHLPSGSGIDSGTKVDLDKSTGDKVVLTTSFHHMNEAGYYDGWTEHTVIVTPAFDGISVRVTGRDRNDIKDYLSEVFNAALLETIDAAKLWQLAVQ